MGQHFLHRQDIAEAIVHACDMTSTQGRVLEIGPGPGVLTEILMGKGPRLKVRRTGPRYGYLVE